ncbi:MAG TPA: ribonuclease domain-containing protein [Burkholderiales bacterium]|jgi:ribonuclease T1|nr:ribonuclease domain-containing protein [Burkholderiales bacterium]
MRAALALLLAVCSTALAFSGTVQFAELPQEARETLVRIDAGGPFAYARDGAVFGNRERQLPARERGYYREYTVKTPGVRGRGPRRIVAGRGGDSYYSDDHYRSFRRIIRP